MISKSILFFFHDNNSLSGASMSALTILDQLSKSKNFNLITFIPFKIKKSSSSLKELLKSKGIRCIEWFYYPNIIYKSTRKINDVIQFFLRWFMFVFSFLSLFFLIPVLILSKTKVLSVYSNTSTIFFGSLLSLILNVKHIWHFREFGELDHGFVRISESLFLYLANKAYKVLTISNILNTFYMKKGFRNTEFLYNDLDSVDQFKKEYKSNQVVRFLVTGTFSDGKGQAFIYDTFYKFKDKFDFSFEIFFAGKFNQYSEKLINHSVRNSFKNVHFLGSVQDMYTLRKTVDFSIINSRMEAFGRTIIEDMLMGIIVIGANRGSLTELISDGVTGFLYQHNNADDLFNKINKIVNNEKKRAAIVQNAYVFSKEFVYNKTSKKIEELLC